MRSRWLCSPLPAVASVQPAATLRPGTFGPATARLTVPWLYVPAMVALSWSNAVRQLRPTMNATPFGAGRITPDGLDGRRQQPDPRLFCGFGSGDLPRDIRYI